ncbi:hypothetical protein M8J75_015551 [Diaphorina citri]|nr:hypothetical protein M8J75_015551 [Diaphorina citri]
MALICHIFWLAFGHLATGQEIFGINNKPNNYENNLDVQVCMGKHKGTKMEKKPMEYLVEHLKETLFIESELPYKAMLAVDRGHYTTWRPYANCITNIGYGAHMQAPFQQAMVLDDLSEELTEGKKVLDIGSGNGYFTALLAWCVGKTGKVIGIEHIPQLVQRATHNVISGNPEFVKDGRIKFVLGDGRKGYLDEAPYDIIHVGGSIEDIPEGLMDQLKPGGVMWFTIGNAEEMLKNNRRTESNLAVVKAHKKDHGEWEEEFMGRLWRLPALASVEEQKYWYHPNGFYDDLDVVEAQGL